MARVPDPLFVDLYQLSMLQAWLAEGEPGEASFSLFVRRLPEQRRYLVACGLEEAIDELLALRFDDATLAWLEGLGRFDRPLLDFLAGFRFTGDVVAMPEGTPVFAEEPLLEVTGPVLEAQLVETMLLNRLHFATLAASKASRVVQAAQGRPIVEFGMRRIHGADAALAVARGAWIAGASATSNTEAGRALGIPLSGTMAHSFVQAHDTELDAFRSFARTWPTGTLLVDTYDTERGLEQVVRLARELGDDFHIRAVRLDSGDLLEEAIRARRVLDAAGLQEVQIFASGGLDEEEIDRLVRGGAPIDGFGVGTAMGVSADAPALDAAYKLVEYEGLPRRKRSTGKVLLPGRKQVFRREQDGVVVEDVLGRRDESLEGKPLLVPVVRGGRRVRPAEPLEQIRERCQRALARLPPSLLSLEPGPGLPVRVSEGLIALAASLDDPSVRRESPQPTQELHP